jgi:hypothetical protein
MRVDGPRSEKVRKMTEATEGGNSKGVAEGGSD